jgi:hypothetical protein
MHIRSKLAVACVVPLIAVAASFAATAASYEVSARLLHDGKSFATPAAVIAAGQPASIEVSGADGYKLTLTVTGAGADGIKVVAELDSAYGSMAPTVTVHPDRPASVSVGRLGLELAVRPRDD